MQDLVGGDGSISFHPAFDDFARSPLPQDLDEYLTYRERSIAFVTARNARIDEWVAAQS